MCYSIYLVHWTVLRPITVGLEWAGCHSVLFTVLVTVPVSVAASIAVGVVFHRAVERRFLAAGPSMPPGVVKIPAPIALRRAS
jgi:peptidoglycan/LPS O-acetylase OafA/YrhL